MTVASSGTVISLSTTNGEVLAFLCCQENGYIAAVGKSSIMFNDLLHMFERWIKDDPEGYDIFKDRVMAAFDLAGRDLDKEGKKNDQKRSYCSC